MQRNEWHTCERIEHDLREFTRILDVRQGVSINILDTTRRTSVLSTLLSIREKSNSEESGPQMRLNSTVIMYNRIPRNAGNSDMDDRWIRSTSASAVVTSKSGGDGDKDRAERTYYSGEGGPVWWLSSLSW